MGCFWSKYIMFGLKKYGGVIFHDTGEWYKIWGEIDVPVQNWQEEFNECWPVPFNGLPLTKVCNVWAEYREVMFDGTEDWCKIWRKTDLCFQKWHEEFVKFSPEHSKISKLGLWWVPLNQSRKRISLKLKEELCIMIMKNYMKFEELTCLFKIDMRYLTNFDPSTRKSQKFAL